jgi:hypothetical protein
MLALATLVLVVGAATPLIFGANQALETESLESASELVALSAADSLSGFRTGHPCEVARSIASQNSVVLESCKIQGFRIEVQVSKSRSADSIARAVAGVTD